MGAMLPTPRDCFAVPGPCPIHFDQTLLFHWSRRMGLQAVSQLDETQQGLETI